MRTCHCTSGIAPKCDPCACCPGRSGCTSCDALRLAAFAVDEHPEPGLDHGERPEPLTAAPPTDLVRQIAALTQLVDIFVPKVPAPVKGRRTDQVFNRAAQRPERPVADRHSHSVFE